MKRIDAFIQYLRHWPGAVLICRFTSICASCFILTGCSEDSPARIVVPEDAIFLGEGEPGETVEGTVELFNTGNSKLRISTIQASCNCTGVSPDSSLIIPPHGKQTIHVKIKLDLLEEEKAARLIVHSNDPRQPAAPFLVFVKCVPFVDVSPPMVDFGVVAPGNSAARRLRLLAPNSSEPATNLGERLEVQSSWLSIHETSDLDGYEVVLSTDAPLGVFSSQIEIFDKAGTLRLTIPVIAHVRSPVFAVPSTLVVRAEASLPVLVKRADGSPLGSLDHIEPSEYLTSRDVTPENSPNSLRRIEIGFRSVAEPLKSSDAKLYFNNYDHPVNLKIMLLQSRSNQAKSSVP